ncbi:transglycosylase domain-containing protein [Nitrospinota bacterium]
MARRRRRVKARKQQSQTHRRLRGVGTYLTREPKQSPQAPVSQQSGARPSGKRLENSRGTIGAIRVFRRFVRFSLAFGLLMAVVASVGAAGFGIYYYQKVGSELPDVNLLRSHKPSLVTRVFDQSGSLLRQYYVERRFLVTLNQVPDVVIQAILATEDARFEEHPGVDLVGIFRAAVRNILDWNVVEGGSTITQQLAKSLFLTPERSLDRKIREAILAVRIERTFSNIISNVPLFGIAQQNIKVD